MTVSKKFFCLLTITLAVTAAAVALPGTKQYLADSSGEYVFYKDNSFKRTSYIGFCYYDDSTYAVRYYAPTDAAQALTEQDITLYFTVNPTAEHLELTGENVTGVTSADDTDVVNYMHDLFYELTARRQKATVSGTEKIPVAQEFAQFGGNVTLTFWNYVPIFNLYSINAVDKTPLLQIQTVGKLTDSTDTSFTSFKGFESMSKDTSPDFATKKSPKKNKVTFEQQTITIDDQWTQSLENMWLLGSTALLSLNMIEVPKEANITDSNYNAMLTRRIMQSTTGSYINWATTSLSVNKKKTVTEVDNVYYQPAKKVTTRDFKIVTEVADGKFAFITLTVFDNAYQKNKKYFDSILKSYQAK
jgi:hypothetical protein